MQDGAWTEEPLDDHVVRLCRDMSLPEVPALSWRDLPDPPPEALAPPDDEDDADDDDPAHDASG